MNSNGWPHRLLITALLVGLSSLDGFALRIVRYPYIQNSTGTSVVIAWMTDLSGDSAVEYGLTPDLDQEVMNPSRTTRHSVSLIDLTPDTYYYYRVKTDGQTLSEIEYFKTANGPENPYFTMAIFGDSGDGSLAQRAVAAQIAAIIPHLILHTGDVVYPNGADFLYNLVYFNIYRDIIKTTTVFPSLGNHDYQTSQGAPYLMNFHLPQNALIPAHRERYYSFRYGGAHFIALDTELVPNGIANVDQRAWLESELAAAGDAFWRFIYFHRPPFSSGQHGSSLSVRAVIAPLAEKYNVDYVFTGHDHTYERTTPILNNQASDNGVLYLVTGGGGAGLYTVGRNPWTAFSGSFHHVAKVTLEGLNLTLEAVDRNGSIRDTFTWRKGELQGLITDQAGSPLDNAMVKVILGARQRAQRETSAGGRAVFYLAEGTYDLETSAPGCATQAAKGISVLPDSPTTLKVALTCESLR